MSDPFEVLGLTRSATVADVRAARRRLALDAHPDRGGDPARMRELNAAVDAAVAHLTGRRPLDSARPTSPGERAPVPRQRSGGAARSKRSRPPSGSAHLQQDVPSFVVEALPAEAYEALLIVASWIGEVLVDEPPYLLDVLLAEPGPCWCRLELVPDAGASTVSLTVAGVEDRPAPDVEEVRDLWVAELNRLGAAPPP